MPLPYDAYNYSDQFDAADDEPINPAGLTVARVFSDDDISPFDQVSWREAPVEIRDATGGAILFHEPSFGAPDAWSDQARKVVASKFAYGRPGDPHRETSAAQVIGRVSMRIARWGAEQGYFRTHGDAARFADEVAWLCIHQYLSFNSPVWFNVGHDLRPGLPESPADNFRLMRSDDLFLVTANDSIHKHPQVHACFIQPVEDTISGIMDLAKSEALLFKHGSGTGTDLSTIRSTREALTAGGRPSGPVSFMRIYDAVAGQIKSGGKTRRAAKIQTLRCDHPDIMEFVQCKWREEVKARALIAAGYSADFNGEAYATVAFQNSNLSVRVTGEFMRSATSPVDSPRDLSCFDLRAVTTGAVVETIDASGLLATIARCAHDCGDPALQFHDTVNDWHTTPTAGPINSSNPCSEYMSLDNSACNLASLRLTAFTRDGHGFDADRFGAAIDVAIAAMDILIDVASYPTAAIAETVHRHRQLGLGYADLGAFLMARGLAYDSAAGRDWCAAITSYLTARAYRRSAELAAAFGPFDAFEADREAMGRVMRKHMQASIDWRRDMGVRDADPMALYLMQWTIAEWEVVARRAGDGFRNSQVTLIAPTGTIGFMMDCDTFGIEPELALVKYKDLAGGGAMKIVNRCVRRALAALGGYTATDVDAVEEHIKEYDTIEDVAGRDGSVTPLLSAHLPVFDCAFPPARGLDRRSIAPEGHVKMMAAAQPFLSGAISKTCNLPNSATVQDIIDIYISAWKMGLKSIAVYRDGSKGTQPVKTAAAEVPAAEVPVSSAPLHERNGHASRPPAIETPAPRRHRLPDTRRSETHHFEISGAHGHFDGYVTVGFFGDGRPGEVFIKSHKGGSTVNGMLDVIGIQTSLLLQHGVAIEAICRKLAHVGFEPAGPTRNRAVPFAKSIVDYVFRWLALNHSDELKLEWKPAAPDLDASADPPLGRAPGGRDAPAPVVPAAPLATIDANTGNACAECGSASLVRVGSACWQCRNCLWSSGGCGG